MPMWRSTWMPALVIAGGFASLVHAGDASICSTSPVAIPDPGSVTATLSVNESLSIEEVTVSVDITHPFAGDLALGVYSPSGTLAILFVGDGEESADVLVTFADDGARFDSANLACDCPMQPWGAGGLAVFTEEQSAGDWQLLVQDAYSDYEGTLNEWCVEIAGCDLAPPAGLACEVDGESVTLSWSNPEPADALSVRRNGASIAELPGTDSSFVDADVGAGVQLYQVVAHDDGEDCDSHSTVCDAEVGLRESCVELESDNIISFYEDPVSSSIEIGDDFMVTEVQAQVEITHTFAGDVTVTLTAPDATALTLYDHGGDSQVRIEVLFSPVGVAHGAVPFDCACRMLPAGPGAMDDFAGSDALGSWTLEASDDYDLDNGELHRWCIGLIGPAGASSPIYIRGDVDGNAAVVPILDALFLLQYSFLKSTAPPCLAAADADGDGEISGLLDALYLLLFGFLEGRAPPPPHPECAADPDTIIECETQPDCD